MIFTKLEARNFQSDRTWNNAVPLPAGHSIPPLDSLLINSVHPRPVTIRSVDQIFEISDSGPIRMISAEQKKRKNVKRGHENAENAENAAVPPC